MFRTLAICMHLELFALKKMLFTIIQNRCLKMKHITKPLHSTWPENVLKLQLEENR
jgi:hypothetical protein